MSPGAQNESEMLIVKVRKLHRDTLKSNWQVRSMIDDLHLVQKEEGIGLQRMAKKIK